MQLHFHTLEKGRSMSLKTATLIAIIGGLFSTLGYSLYILKILTWSPLYSLSFLVLGEGTLLLFLSVLYAKQISQKGA